MFQPPGSPETMRGVHEVEIAEARRQAELRRGARTRSGVRRSVGRALVAIGVALGGERPHVVPEQEHAGGQSPAPARTRAATVNGGW